MLPSIAFIKQFKGNYESRWQLNENLTDTFGFTLSLHDLNSPVCSKNKRCLVYFHFYQMKLNMLQNYGQILQYLRESKIKAVNMKQNDFGAGKFQLGVTECRELKNFMYYTNSNFEIHIWRSKQVIIITFKLSNFISILNFCGLVFKFLCMFCPKLPISLVQLIQTDV